MQEHRSSCATCRGAKLVETPPGAAWIVVADQAQESVARLIVAHAALHGEATALALNEKQKSIFIHIYPLVSLAEEALIACPNTGEKVTIDMAGCEVSEDESFGNVAPVICRHCGETHAWALKAA